MLCYLVLGKTTQVNGEQYLQECPHFRHQTQVFLVFRAISLLNKWLQFQNSHGLYQIS